MGIFISFEPDRLKEVEHSSQDSFELEAYNRFNDERISEFLARYDLSTEAGIESIPVEEARRYPDGGQSVVYMPEQILNRKATEYKKQKKYDLAISCLRKANELYPHSFYAYQRDSYERLVDMLVLAGRFQEAKETHLSLDRTVGTYLNMLEYMKEHSNLTDEQKVVYQKLNIDKHIEEFQDREEYYYLLEHFPALAPRSFWGYRKMKNSNSANYKKIIDALGEHNVDLFCVKFWL